MKDDFIEIDGLGNLKFDKVLFEANYPILFICKNEKKQLFLCSCCRNNGDERKWIITKTVPSTIVKILKDEITLREAFLEFKDIQYSITMMYNNSNTVIEKNNINDWHEEYSIFLPDKDEYMDVEEGEFDDEIEHYSSYKQLVYATPSSGIFLNKPQIVFNAKNYDSVEISYESIDKLESDISSKFDNFNDVLKNEFYINKLKSEFLAA